MEEAAGKLKQSSMPLRTSQPASFWKQRSAFETLLWKQKLSPEEVVMWKHILINTDISCCSVLAVQIKQVEIGENYVCIKIKFIL